MRLMFQDEAGFGQINRPKYCWCKKGIRPACQPLAAPKVIAGDTVGLKDKLHWVLDMQFREDESRARTDNSAENLNVLRHWAFNLLKADTSLRGSFSDKQFKCLLDDAFLDKIIASALCS